MGRTRSKRSLLCAAALAAALTAILGAGIARALPVGSSPDERASAAGLLHGRELARAGRSPDAARTVHGAAVGNTLISSAETIALGGSDTGFVNGSSAANAVWKVWLTPGQKVFVEAYGSGSGSAGLWLLVPGVTDAVLAADAMPTDDMIAARCVYDYVGVSTNPAYHTPLRLSFTVPAGQPASWYYPVVYGEGGNVNVTLVVRPGPVAFTVNTPSTVNWTQRFQITGSVDAAGSDISHSSVEAWVVPLGVDNNGVDHMFMLAPASLISATNWWLPPRTPNANTLPWSSRLYIEWTGHPSYGWIDSSKILYVRANTGIKASRRSVTAGTKITFSGRVDPLYARTVPAVAGLAPIIRQPKIAIQSATLRGKRYGRWVTLKKATFAVSAAGTYKYVYKTVRGTRGFRVAYTPGLFTGMDGLTYSRYAAGYSSIVKVVAK
jgi:hypothetical protein